MIIKVKGADWDVESVEDGIVTFADGSTTQVSATTEALIQKALKPKRRRRKAT